MSQNVPSGSEHAAVIEAVEVECEGCGAIHVFTRNRRRSLMRAGAPYCCGECRTLLPGEYERGTWNHRLIQPATWKRRLIGPAAIDTAQVRARESRVVSIMLTTVSAFLTSAVPITLAGPKRGPGDWLAVYVLIGMACAAWLLTLLSWWQIIRSRRQGS